MPRRFLSITPFPRAQRAALALAMVVSSQAATPVLDPNLNRSGGPIFTNSSSLPQTPIPEPETLPLGLAAVLFFLLRRRTS